MAQPDIKVKPPESIATMQDFQKNIDSQVKALQDAANKQLSAETSLLTDITKEEGILNEKSVNLNGPPPPINYPTVQEFMDIFHPIINEDVPPPATGVHTGSTGDYRTTVYDAVEKSLSQVLASPSSTHVSTHQQRVEAGEIPWLEETVKSSVRSALLGIPVDTVYTVNMQNQLIVDLTNAIDASGIFPQPGKETFLGNLQQNLFVELTSIPGLNYTPVTTADGANLKSAISNALNTVFQDVFEQGAQGATLAFAAAEENAAYMYDYVQNLLSYTSDFEKLVDNSQAATLLAAQDITTADVNAWEFYNKFQMLDATNKDAADHNQGGWTLNTISDTIKKLSGIVDTMVKGPGHNQSSDIDLAELNAVQSAAEVAALKASNNQLTSDTQAAQQAAQKVANDITTDFTKSVTNLSTSMSDYTKELNTYLTKEHQYKLAEANQQAYTTSANEVTNLQATVKAPAWPASTGGN